MAAAKGLYIQNSQYRAEWASLSVSWSLVRRRYKPQRATRSTDLISSDSYLGFYLEYNFSVKKRQTISTKKAAIVQIVEAKYFYTH